MPEFKIEGGNSTDGEIGFVAYVDADTPEQALATFRRAVGWDSNEMKICVDRDAPDVCVQVYFNPDKFTVEEHVTCDEDDAGLPAQTWRADA